MHTARAVAAASDVSVLSALCCAVLLCCWQWDGTALGMAIPYKSAHVVMIVYDVCNKQSFDRVYAQRTAQHTAQHPHAHRRLALCELTPSPRLCRCSGLR